MNRIYKFLIIVVEITIIYLIFYKKVIIPCIIKELFSIACPACGLTRAFKSFMSLDINSAISYNVLSIPILVLLVLTNIYLIYDIIANKKQTNKFFNKLGRYYILIIIVLILSTIINNVNGI